MTSLKEQVLERFSLQSDEPEVEKLFFNFDDYAVQVKSLILDDKLPTPFVIAIHGEWGSGKTTFIKRVKKLVDAEISSNEKIQTLEFDVWEYERVDVISSLFELIRVKYKKLGKQVENFGQSAGYFLTDLAIRKTTGMALNEAKSHFSNFISRISTIKSDLEELTKDGRLIIFVDDLDRCHIDNVLNLLEAVKMFFTAKGVIFVVAVDLGKIERAWKLRYNLHEGMIEGREHVEKIFQLKLSLPIKDISINHFVVDVIPSLSQSEQQLIGVGCKFNPRRIKRVLNLIYFILKNLRDDKTFDVKVSPTIAWCVLISYCPEIAKTIRLDPRVFVQLSFLCANMSFNDIKEKWQKIRDAKQNGSNITLKNFTISRDSIDVGTVESLELMINQYENAYGMFRSFGLGNSFTMESGINPTTKLDELHKKFDQIIVEILLDGGMTGI